MQSQCKPTSKYETTFEFHSDVNAPSIIVNLLFSKIPDDLSATLIKNALFHRCFLYILPETSF